MVRKICLDTDILINMMRNDSHTRGVIAAFDADFYTTTVNVFELWQGHKKGKETMELLEPLIKIDFDEKSAFVAGDIQKKLFDKGDVLDFRDIFIGAMCIKNDMELLTFNVRHFERMKKFGLRMVYVKWENS